MDNLLPTITVLMAEASVVLLILLGFLCWRYLRRKRQHEAEIETLIAMAQGREITLPAANAIASPNTAQGASARESQTPDNKVESGAAQTDGQEPVPPDQEAAPAEPVVQSAAPAIDYGELAARLAEIRHAQELMDAKLNQLRHEHQKLAANIFRALEKTGKDVAASRHEIEHGQQLLGELRKRITALPSMLSVPLASVVATQANTPRRPEPAPQRPAPASEVGTAVNTGFPGPGVDGAAEHQGLDASDPDLILDQETIDRIAEPVPTRPGNGGIAVEEISLDDLDPRDIHEAISVKSPLFSPRAQVFFQSSTHDVAQGWYFSVDGSPPQGPFSDKLTAELVMEEVTGIAPQRREMG